MVYVSVSEQKEQFTYETSFERRLVAGQICRTTVCKKDIFIFTKWLVLIAFVVILLNSDIFSDLVAFLT